MQTTAMRRGAEHLALVSVLALFGGCTAAYWGGQDAGQTPGLHVRAGNLFSGPTADYTPNGSASLKDLSFSETRKDGSTKTFAASGFTTTQNVSEVEASQVAKIDAIARLQEVQVDYVKATFDGLSKLAQQIVPLLELFATAGISSTEHGLTLTLPNGASLGGKTITTPADLAGIIQAANSALHTVATGTPMPAATQPASGTDLDHAP